MRKKDLKCEQCGQTWRWPSDVERAGLCVNCAANLSHADNQQRGFVEMLVDPRICPKGRDTGDEHLWDGPEVVIGPYGSVSCSRCGALAIDVDQWIAP